jgi:hypothetical protein
MRLYAQRRNIDVVLTAVGKALDLGNALSVFHTRLTQNTRVKTCSPYFHSDIDALRSDWVAVGMDLNRAIEIHSSTHGKE